MHFLVARDSMPVHTYAKEKRSPVTLFLTSFSEFLYTAWRTDAAKSLNDAVEIALPYSVPLYT